MLARAFEPDPVSSYLFPDAGGRRAALERFFRIQLRRNYLGRGEVWVEGALRGAALWMPPRSEPPSALTELAMHLGLLSVFGSRIGAARRLARLLADRHPRAAHYYLGTLGTEPAHQRQGIATALLAPVLARCDAERLPAYLESSRAENVRYYEARGFAVVDDVAIADGPHLWLMWRRPGAVGAGPGPAPSVAEPGEGGSAGRR